MIHIIHRSGKHTRLVKPNAPLFGALRACGRRIGRLAIGLALLASVAQATTVRQFNLGGLVERSDRIFRATVMDVKPGFVEAGGGQIPIITYRLKVTESLRGSPEGEIELRLLSDSKDAGTVGSPRRFPVFGDLPRLERGGEYLLFATAPSRIGLCTFVGLGQGCFRVRTQEKQEIAVNGFNNAGLGFPAAGAIGYQDLVTRIRSLLSR